MKNETIYIKCVELGLPNTASHLELRNHILAEHLELVRLRSKVATLESPDDVTYRQRQRGLRAADERRQQMRQRMVDGGGGEISAAEELTELVADLRRAHFAETGRELHQAEAVQLAYKNDETLFGRVQAERRAMRQAEDTERTEQTRAGLQEAEREVRAAQRKRSGADA